MGSCYWNGYRVRDIRAKEMTPPKSMTVMLGGKQVVVCLYDEAKAYIGELQNQLAQCQQKMLFQQSILADKLSKGG